MKINTIINDDCMKGMTDMEDNCVSLTITDIPYTVVNRDDNGLRTLSKGTADIGTFETTEFLSHVFRVTSDIIIIFCGKEQFSEIYEYFAGQNGTARALVWEKTNPSPMNGQYVYLSGIELAVWFKKRGSKSFNAFCKNTVFKHSSGSSKVHPTEKNHGLLKELILDNSNEGDTVFDPCAGSGSHLLVAKQNNRSFLGFEINRDWYEIALSRVK